tara:strand:+ start:2195 stop:3082 length:888 start_codon:yes stop_codon:yes gene_type:complete
MANFTSFLDILPDPNNKIGAGGESLSSGETGPGFASIKFTSEAPIMKSRTNSGRVVSRAIVGHQWKIALTYNPLTRAEFEPVNSFLMSRRGGLVPFFLSLPQYRVPQDSTFASHIDPTGTDSAITVNLVAGNLIVGNSYIIQTANSTNFALIGASASTAGLVFTATDHGANDGIVKASAGSTSIMIQGLSGSSGDPKVGDLFTITDSADSNHTKAYMVTRIETASAFHTNLSPTPAATERIIHFTPGLQRAVSNSSVVNFHNPKIRVLMTSDVQEYSLNADNLYSFSLNLEEAQP